LSGYIYRFIKEDNVYQWIKITDEDIVNAMSAASNAQDTADNKRRIFVVQPSTPYDKGDLWHVTNVDGVDFKICTKTRSKNESYSASDWENVEKSKDYIDSQISDLDDALDDLQDNINAFGKDLILTATEASMITIDLEKATSDSENLVIMAASLGITTERIDYDNAVQEIYSYLYTNWLEKEYPLEITEIQVSAVTDCFNDIEKKKTILINKISEVRNDNLKNYVDNNAVMQDFDYNKTKISQQEGIEVFDNLNNRVLQMGGIAVGSNPNVKDAYGFKAPHTDGSFSAMVKDGFIRKWEHGESAYLNDIHIMQSISTGNDRDEPLMITLELPERFKGRSNTKIMLIPYAFNTSLLGRARYGSFYVTLRRMSLALHVDNMYWNLTKPKIDITAYLLISLVGDDGEIEIIYRDISFDLIAIGV